MAITKDKKGQILKKLEDKFSKAQAVYFAENKGLTVKDVSALRKKLRESGVDFVVAKKTLMKLAAKNQNLPEITDEIMTGPIAAVIGYEDMIIPSKIVKDFGATVDNRVVLTGGIMEGKLLSKAQAMELASLPSKQELLARLVRTIKGPISGFYMVLKGLHDKKSSTTDTPVAAPAVTETAPVAETPAAPVATEAAPEAAAPEAPVATQNSDTPAEAA